MSTDLTDITAFPLTPLASEDLAARHRLALEHAAAEQAEAASHAELARVWQDVAEVFARRLTGPVSLLPPAAPPEVLNPEEPLPCEKAAHQAVEQQEARAGRDPYDPATVPHLPRVNGFVHVDTDGPRESESLVGGVSR